MKRKQTLAQRIRELRGDRTQEECTAATDMRQGTWSNLESEKTEANPTLETLKAVCRGLGCDMATLFDF